MAANDNGISFPIFFDLDAAVKKASQDWDGKYADQLEKAIQKRAIEIKLRVNTSNFDDLDAVKQRLAQLKIEPITPETKTAIKELAAELRTLAKALEQVQKYAVGKNAVSPDAVRAARISEINQRAADNAAIALENQRAAAARAAAAEEKLALARDKSAQAAARTAKGVRDLTRTYKEQSSYLDRLIQRMVTYWSVQQVKQFLTSIREVTAQFELQRVSLGAIIQDQTRANALYSEIKNFAIKSPLSIMDLTKYTKQVAAYKIETDKLFDTTKRLADVSVGLGVDMERLVLAYGQVKAASYLRAAEIRQFTEAGIPMLELLAEKFTELNGEMVTTEQVMDMVSKRMVGFGMVEEIFNDMTSAGGMFYNMQEKQGNTLYGMWAKLGDAASMMYEEIGNTSLVNEGMKSAIQGLSDLMKNWRLVGAAIAGVGIIYARHKIAVANAAIAEQLLTKATMEKVLALSFEKNALMQKMATQTKATLLTRIDNQLTLAAIKAKIAAATATNVFSKALYGMKAALLSNPIGVVITALVSLGAVLYDAWRKAHKLSDELAKIEAERITASAQSVRNFEHLANAAVKAADGSKAQRDALDELKRAYRDILPVEDLKIEKLRAMKGDYTVLTQAIEEYIAMQQKQKALDTVNEVYGGEIQEMSRKIMENMKSMGFSAGEAARFQVEFAKQADVAGKTLREKVEDAIRLADLEFTDKQMEQLLGDKSGWRWWLDKSLGSLSFVATGQTQLPNMFVTTATDIERLAEAQTNLAESTQEVHKQFSQDTEKLGEYAKVVERTQKVMADFVPMRDGKPLDNSTYEYQVQRNNKQVVEWAKEIKEAMSKAGIEIKDEWVRINDDLSESDPAKWAALNLKEIIKAVDGAKFPQLKKWLGQLQREYENIRPTDGLVTSVNSQFKQIADAAGVNMDLVHRYMMKTGQSLKDFRKTLEDESKALAESITELSLVPMLAIDYVQKQKEKADEEQRKAFIDELLARLPKFGESGGGGGGGRQSDPRLGILQEMASTLKKVNKEYGELLKKEGSAKALADTQEKYANTFTYLQSLASKYNFELPDFGVPTDAKSLTKYLEALKGAMSKLSKSEKAVLQVETDIADIRMDEAQKKIEAELKELADRIARTKTAKEFYEKILGATGDIQLAARVSTAIYGDDGFELQKRLAEQVRQYFQNDVINVEIPIDVIGKDNRINYKRLGEFAEQMKETLGAEPYKAIKKIAEEGEKDLAKAYEGYFNDLAKAETYASKRVKLAQTTAEKIRKIRADMESGETDKSVGESLISGFIDKEIKEAAKLEWEAFKDTPLYVQMFEDLEHASTSTLEMMKSRLDALSRTWGSALDPTQLKEMQGRMNEIDTQLRERNPWKSLKSAYEQYKAATDSVTLTGAVANAGTAAKDFDEASEIYGADSAQAKAAQQELAAREKIVKIVRQITVEQGKQVTGQEALTLAQQKAFDQAAIARGNLEIANAELIAATQKAEAKGKKPATDPGVIAAQEKVKAAEVEVELTQRVSDILDENARKSKTLKESLVGAAQNVTQFLQIGSDIAAAIATTMEALGADEEDVQYFNDIAAAIGDITAGFQGLIDSAMALNVGGIISNAVGIIPNMVKGFVGLFSAGKVRKANKEIKRQQELLDELEYAYSRLEKAAERAFGSDYINNFKAQQRNLEAQARAYQAQAAAERSKGKKADEEKIKEYENAYRETMDAIADMQSKLMEQFTGTTRYDFARQLANSWIDARSSMSDTFAAIQGDYKDMLKNMLVETMAAKIVENAFSLLWDDVDKKLQANDVDGAVDAFINGMDRALGNANDGLDVWWKAMEARGYDMKKLLGDTDSNLTGISREIAGASEESINGLAAMMNTQNYYASRLPSIDVNVARICAMMEGGGSGANAATARATDYTPMIRQSLENQGMMIRYQAETLAECKAQTELIRKVIIPAAQAKGSYKVYVGM